jgi:hypothetical protein
MSDITSDSDVALSKDSSDSSITEDLYLPQPSAFSPRPSSAATSMQQDDASHSSDDTTHVSRFKSPKGFKF